MDAVMKSRVEKRLVLYKKELELNARLLATQKTYDESKKRAESQFRQGQCDLQTVRGELRETSGYSNRALPCPLYDQQMYDCSYFRHGLGANKRRFMQWRRAEQQVRREGTMATKQRRTEMIGLTPSWNQTARRSSKAVEEPSSSGNQSAMIQLSEHRTSESFKSMWRQMPANYSAEQRSQFIDHWIKEMTKKYLARVTMSTHAHNGRFFTETAGNKEDLNNRRKEQICSNALSKESVKQGDECQKVLSKRPSEKKSRELDEQTKRNTATRSEKYANTVSTAAKNNHDEVSRPMKDLEKDDDLATPMATPTNKATPSSRIEKFRSSGHVVIAKELFSRRVAANPPSDDESSESEEGPYIAKWRRDLIIEAPPHSRGVEPLKSYCTMPKSARKRALKLLVKLNTQRLKQMEIK